MSKNLKTQYTESLKSKTLLLTYHSVSQIVTNTVKAFSELPLGFNPFSLYYS